ncbi:hypothetical protein OG292_19840 [Streptomyces sp. NBC_01511]|uniref:hypothetical protein n=1 Tax=Streptomyces sp. NBC_01511 TaxID=2903889 RepID=UPI0038639300
MHTRSVTAALAAALLLTLTACSTDTDTTKRGETSEAAPAADPKPAADAAKDDADVEGDTLTLPDLTGRTLQAAQDAAQEAGFFALTSSDLTGAERMQVLDRNWQVCTQSPKAGSHPADTTVDFGAVKTTESCP